jgi:hypothetical protein
MKIQEKRKRVKSYWLDVIGEEEEGTLNIEVGGI